MLGERKLRVPGWLLMVFSGVMVLVTSVAGPLSEPADASGTGSIYQAAASRRRLLRQRPHGVVLGLHAN